MMTGHCATPPGCPRWETGCGACPDLSTPPPVRRDATRINWWRKRRMFRGARLYASAETQWMLDRLGRSLLAPAVRDSKVIPGGVDLEVFAPGSRVDSRRELGLDPEVDILLTVANMGAANPLKDFSTIRAALADIARRDPQKRIDLLVVGGEGGAEKLGPMITVHHLGYVRVPSKLAAFYRAADAYVHSAVEEPFGLSVAEAIACGLPVVTASSGGVRETVDHGSTALVVPARDANGLAISILRLLGEPSLRASMAANAIKARSRFDRNAMIAALHDWCTRIHARWAP
jgi:glycosyltransferase involved in cell wall biosynthesis